MSKTRLRMASSRCKLLIRYSVLDRRNVRVKLSTRRHIRLFLVCFVRVTDISEEEEEEFYTLLLQLLSYRTILAVERQTWCGTAPTYRETMMQLHGAYGDTTYSRDETDTGC